MVDNPIHHGGYFNPPWWILEFTKFTCFILMICIFIFQQTQKQDGGYLNPQNKWNVGSDAFIIAQNINHKRERGVLLKATLFILTKLKMIDPYRHWRTSTDFYVRLSFLSDIMFILDFKTGKCDFSCRKKTISWKLSRPDNFI